ncbi:hypothetical protein ACFXKR_15220 [Streptomyces violascens]|uniref:hypothetical protein n=1 Tax=Streptomyces violascens TaxID=67381 RepID=UPI0036874A5E
MKARIRLAPAAREVHVLDEVREVALVGNPPRRGLSRRWSRGPYVGRQWTYEKGPDGRRHKVVLFDSRHMRAIPCGTQSWKRAGHGVEC